MGYVDIFRKLWGWLSGETAQVVPGPKVTDKVNFITPTEQANMVFSQRDKLKIAHTVTDAVDFVEG